MFDKKQNKSLVIVESDVEKILSTSVPNLLCCYKDKDSKYLYCNEAHAAAAGVDSPKKMIGYSDFEFCWRDRAEFYQATDRLVMRGDTSYFNIPEKVQATHDDLTMMVTKYQVINKEGQCIGVMGVNSDITGYCLVKKAGFYDKNKKILYLNNTGEGEYLTSRELDVLKLLMRGYTAKKIGMQLNISYRTVEMFINILKSKLNCDSKSDISSTAIQNGLVYLIVE